MSLSFTPLSWLLWGRKNHQEEPTVPTETSLNYSSELGMWELDTLKFPMVHRGNMKSSSRRVKKKWHSREERKVDKEYDVVLVPSDGGCFSGSESDDSDWSIGWLEPHGPGFHTDDDSDSSFAVLVPCYGRGRGDQEDNSKNKFLGNIGNVSDLYAAGIILFCGCMINYFP